MTPADKIDTVAKLEALPFGTVLKDSDGNKCEVVGITVLWQGMDADDQPRVATPDGDLMFDDALHYYGPFTEMTERTV